jgi:iron complex outermembrane receptor protein
MPTPMKKSRPTLGATLPRAAVILAATVASQSVLAQTADTARVQPLTPFAVSVTRDATRSTLELPFSLARVTPDSLHPGLRRASLGEFLFGIPGLQVSERNNPSQDPRLAVRGFGARSAFGVRGVRVLRDGIPLTLPDGQTPIDWMDLESAGTVEAIRGTAASLYGNAAGGVVSIRSRAPDAAPFALTARGWDGGNVRRASVLASGSGPAQMGPVSESGYLVSGTRTEGDGPREYSRQKATSLFGRALGTVKGTRLELQAVSYDAPTGENPGALTAAELSRNPRLSDSMNITKHSRKAVEQSQLALIASRGRGATEVTGSLFMGTRTLDNPLPFAIVGVDRRTYGGSLRAGGMANIAGFPMRMSAGFDAQTQKDHRFNFENCSDVLPSVPVTTRCPVSGQERGAVRLNQNEDIQGEGAFVRYELEVPRRLLASVSLRYDRVRFKLTDRFITSTNSDDSGERSLIAASPMAGLVYRVTPLFSVYANVASAFETPTITELTNQPDGQFGLNQELQPQRTRTAEMGVNGILGAHVRVDAAMFTASARDELVGFDVPNAVGRRAFRNAGRTQRRGLETNLAVVGSWGEMGAAYTLSRFNFVTYSVGTVNYAGKPIPGVPTHQGQAYLTLRKRGWYVTSDAATASRVSADDASTVFASSWTTLGVRVGRAPANTRWAIEPTFGVDNLFDRTYASAVVINATRGRYYEPGVGRRVFVALRTGITPWVR